MNIHLAFYTLDPASWNGHAQMMRFLVDGLHAAGHTITATYRDPTAAVPRHVFSTYAPSLGWQEVADLQAPASCNSHLWNGPLVSWAAALLRQHETDVVYAQGGGDILDVVQAGATNGMRLVYHVHDYDLFCKRRFLLDHACRPCSGPDSVAKCWDCVRRQYAWHAQALAVVSRIPGVLHFAPPPLKTQLLRYAYHEDVAHDLSRARATAASVHCFIATGAPVTNVLRRFGIPDDRITVLPHTVTRPELAEAPPPSIRQPGPVRIGFFGRFAPEKGVDILARVLAGIAAERTFAFDWHIICDGREDAIRAMMRANRFADSIVTHVQCKDAPAIVEALRAIDIAVFPSPWPEIGPLALLECLRQGVVCVASDSLAMAAAITEGVSGYVFPSTDERGLLHALCRATELPVVRGAAHRRPLAPAPDHLRYFTLLTNILVGHDSACSNVEHGALNEC